MARSGSTGGHVYTCAIHAQGAAARGHWSAVNREKAASICGDARRNALV